MAGTKIWSVGDEAVLIIVGGIQDPCVTVSEVGANHIALETAEGPVILRGEAMALLWPSDSSAARRLS